MQGRGVFARLKTGKGMPLISQFCDVEHTPGQPDMVKQRMTLTPESAFIAAAFLAALAYLAVQAGWIAALV